MRAVLLFIAVFSADLAFGRSAQTPTPLRAAVAQPVRKPTQAPPPIPDTGPGANMIPPPPPGPPPDFMDDSEFEDEGDDLMDDYPRAPVTGGNSPGSMQQVPVQVQPAPPMNRPPPPAPTAGNRGGGDGGKAFGQTTGKIRFQVVKGEYLEKGKKRPRGNKDRR